MSRILVWKILRVTALLVLLLSLCAIFVIIFSHFLFYGNPIANYLDTNSYKHDEETLFQVAQTLGYKREDQLNFFRYRGAPESNDDVTKLIFSTTDSLDTFSENVNKLRLTPDNSLVPYYQKEEADPNFFGFINEKYPYSLVLTDKRSEETFVPSDLIPISTRWYFIISSSAQRVTRIEIYYARLPKGDLFWKDKHRGIVIKEPIVLLKLNR